MSSSESEPAKWIAINDGLRFWQRDEIWVEEDCRHAKRRDGAGEAHLLNKSSLEERLGDTVAN